MTCLTPVKGTIHEDRIIFGDSQDGSPIYLPCGQCFGCRTDFTKDWAVRCMHEAQTHKNNCVLTLTFDENNLNAQSTLVKSDIQKIHQETKKKNQKKISYLYCGEYGSKFERPHYHIIIFGYDFSDKIFLKKSESGDDISTSKTLDSIWGFGHATIGSMSMASAMYCASYITKFTPVNERKDIYGDRLPEFGHASKKPALGLTWFKNTIKTYLLLTDVLFKPNIIVSLVITKKKLKELHPELFDALKIRIEKKLDGMTIDWNDLSNKYEIALSKIKDSGKLKSSNNYKRAEYLRMIKQRKHNVRKFETTELDPSI